jgi:hypothetical protein
MANLEVSLSALLTLLRRTSTALSAADFQLSVVSWQMRPIATNNPQDPTAFPQRVDPVR